MAGYTRQSSADIIATAVVRANPLNVEYNALRDAFSASTGHKHDGTTAEGAYVPLIADSDALNKVAIDTSNNRVGVFVEVSSAAVEQIRIQDGAVVPVTTNDIDLGTSSLQFKDLYLDGTATIDVLQVDTNSTLTGNLTVNGNTTLGNAASDTVTVTADVASPLIPSADDTYDLGAVGSEWRNLYIDGTANIDALVADTADINGGTVDGAVIGGASAAAITGTTITGTSFVIGSADINEAELETIDGVTAGTVAASKAIVVDSNKDFTGARNITITGELDAATLETDALSIASTAVTSTAAELNIVDGDTSASTITLADADRVIINDNGTMKQVAITNLTTYLGGNLGILSSVTAVGALDSGSITSGFGAINNGSSTITTTGNITGGNIIIGDGGNIGSASDTDAMSIAAGGNVTVSQDLIVSGNLTVSGTQTVVDTVTINAQNAIVFEGATPDNHETTLTIVDPTADRTINLPNQSGTVPVLAAASNTAITATPAELNIIDGGTSATSTTVVDADRVVMNDDGTMVQVAVTDLATYFNAPATAVGALNSGSITSGFGAIDNGSSAITTTGTITGGTVSFGSITDGAITATAFVDEDNMSSNSATLIPTQQSVKAYVDSVAATSNNVTGLNSTGAEINTVADFSAVSVDTSTAIANNDALLVFDNGNEIGYRDVDLLDTYFSGTTKTLTNKTLTSPIVTGMHLNDSGFTVEGSGADGNETTVAFTNPTADHTITFPNATGTVALSNSSSATFGGNGSSGGVTLQDGLVSIRTGTGSVAAMRFYCESSNAHYTELKSAAHSAYSGNLSFSLPAADGSSGQFLTTNGSGALSFADAASGGATLEATASGSLSNGDKVVINSDGTVSVIGVGLSAGSIVDLLDETISNFGSTFDSDSNKVVLAYQDASKNGKVVVGTVSGTSISFGTPVTFHTPSIAHEKPEYITLTFDSNSNKVVLCYQDENNNSYGTAKVGTVSGTSISFGSAVVFNSAVTKWIATTFDSNSNKVVVFYSSDSIDGGYSKVGTVSGTSISFGSEVLFGTSTYTYYTQCTFDSNSNKVVVFYDSNTGNNITARVGTVSGTSISYGTANAFHSYYANSSAAVFDSNSNKVVYVFNDSGYTNGSYVGTVSGTSISFGSKVTISSNSISETSAVFDSNLNKVIVVYQDSGNSDYGTFVEGTVSGTSISYGGASVFNSVRTDAVFPVFDSNANATVVTITSNSGAPNYTKTGDLVVIGSSSNISAENYIGISDAAYSNGATATIQITGSVDDAQSGLTAGQRYFVQGDGTLATTADTIPVLAGIAVSSSKLIVISEKDTVYVHPNHTGEVTSTADGATVIADNIVDEANLKVSNSPSNGYFLSAQSGNTGGLTWAEANNYVHPNHSGEVTSTADGATVIADNVVDEANLKVSNSPTNGYVLTAQSGNTGGLTWASASGGASDINGLSDAVSNSYENVALGTNSGTSFLTGSPRAEYNTFVGYNSGTNLTSGESNVAVGAYALNTATTADWNIAIGVNSLKAVTEGTHNIGIGYQTARTITTGIKNLALGNSSLYSNTTGSYNISLGDNAGYHITTGPENTIVGFEAGRNLTTGTENTSLGYQSGNRYGTAGSYNVSVGSLAMGTAANSSNSNSYNVAVGYQSLYVVDGGQTNTALGSQVLGSLTTGDFNAGVGGSALSSVTTGVRNTGVGFLAGYTTTTGDNNSSLGNFAKASTATASNEVTLGNTSITALRCQVTSITSLSDSRDKTDIAPLQAGLDFVEHLNPVSFTWNMRDGGKIDIEDTGFIAQDLQQVQQDTGVNIPGLVYDENPEKLEAAYGKLVPVLVQAIKDLSAKVNELESQIK